MLKRRRRVRLVERADVVHSGDPAFDALPGYFWERFGPAVDMLLDAGKGAGEIRADIAGRDLVRAVALLCMPVRGGTPAYGQRMVAVLVDGLRVATAMP